MWNYLIWKWLGLPKAPFLNPAIVQISVNTKNSLESLSLLVFKKIKGPNWLKFLIIFVLCLTLIYYSIPNILFILSIFKGIKISWVKSIGLFPISLGILYNLFTLHFLIKYSQMQDNDIVIQRYLPKFIKNYLIKLKETSKNEALIHFLDLYVRSTISMFVLLIGLIFILDIFLP